jgi:hypothetical protein
MKRVSILGVTLFGFSILAFAGPGTGTQPGSPSSTVPAAAGTGTIDQPEKLPQTIPPTAASLYRVTFEIGRGMPFREFVRVVPNAYTVREPGDVVGACRRLGLKAEHMKANLSDALAAKGAFLARNREGNWLLYRVRDGVIQRIDAVAQTVAGVAEKEFLEGWTHDLITLAAYTPQDYENAPRIEFTEAKRSFGQVWQGENLEHLFTFENTGSSPLDITSVQASCGCTAAVVSRMITGQVAGVQTSATEVKTSGTDAGGVTVAQAGGQKATVVSTGRQKPGTKQTFAPGEAGSIKVTFRTASKMNQVSSNVTVYSNDPQSPATVLMVSARVLVPVEVRPTIVRFNRVAKGSDLQREVHIRAPNDPEFEIQTVHGNHEKVSWTLNPVHEERGEKRIPAYKLNVSVDIEGADLGTTIRDTIVLNTTSKQKPVITIPVEATVVGDLYLAPTSFTYTGAFPNRDLVRYAMLRNNSPRDVHIVEVRNGIDDLAVEVTPLEGGRHYRIKATLTLGEKPEPFEGMVVLVTDHPEQSEIPIPVELVVPQLQPPTGQLQRPAPGKVTQPGLK